MSLNFNPLSNNDKGDFVLYTNKKTGKVDVIDYEIEKGVVVLVLKEKGKWKTLSELRKYKYARMISTEELKKIYQRAKKLESIKTASSPTTLKFNI